jgi:hypothetical protein
MHPGRPLMGVTRPPHRRLDPPTKLHCPLGAGGKVVVVGLRGHLAPPLLVAGAGRPRDLASMAATRGRASNGGAPLRGGANGTGRHRRQRQGVLERCGGALRPANRPPPARRQLDVCPPSGLGAGTGLAFGAARGNPAPARGPAGCLPVGLPPRRLRVQGRCGTRCAPFLASLRDGLRPALTAPVASRPGETRSPGAGEEPSPTSSQHEEAEP